jgi:hypothetical protein
MIAFAFLLSCLFSSNRTAVVFAFLWVFGTGLIGNLLLENFINADRWYMILIELVPAFSLYRWAAEGRVAAAAACCCFACCLAAWLRHPAADS